MTSSISNIELEKIQQPLQAANNDEIDLREVGRALGRHRRVIAGVTGAMVLLSGLYALIKKPVWEGQFQIVLEDKDSSQSGSQEPSSQPNVGSICRAFRRGRQLA